MTDAPDPTPLTEREARTIAHLIGSMPYGGLVHVHRTPTTVGEILLYLEALRGVLRDVGERSGRREILLNRLEQDAAAARRFLGLDRILAAIDDLPRLEIAQGPHSAAGAPLSAATHDPTGSSS